MDILRDAILQKQKLKPRETPLPLPVLDLALRRGSGQWAERARNLRNRCAAQSLCSRPDGAFGWKSGARTTEKARAEALKFCRSAPHCDVIILSTMPLWDIERAERRPLAQSNTRADRREQGDGAGGRQKRNPEQRAVGPHRGRHREPAQIEQIDEIRVGAAGY